MILHIFSELISNNIHTFRELLPKKSKHIYRLHIKQYWHFQGVTPKQYCTLFQTSNSTDIFSELLANSTTHFSRVYIKQYWHFQRVTSKLNYCKNFFQSSYHTIMTLSESYYQTILTYSELISNSIHTPTELLWTLEHIENSQTENSQVKVRKVSMHRWNR